MSMCSRKSAESSTESHVDAFGPSRVAFRRWGGQDEFQRAHRFAQLGTAPAQRVHESLLRHRRTLVHRCLQLGCPAEALSGRLG
jgi:hypothetical protein